jgi:hypothetical protein
LALVTVAGGKSIGPGTVQRDRMHYSTAVADSWKEQRLVSVPCEGVWFWIDRRDLVSKTTLSAVTILFNFLEVDSKAAPMLTIPTN